MNLTPSSDKGIAIVLLAVVLVAATGAATAVTMTEDDVPEEKQVGTDVTATVTLTDLYANSSEWELRAESNLTGTLDWGVSKAQFGNAGTSNENVTGSTYETTINRDDDVETVTITVTGTVPVKANSTYNYDPRQNISAITVYRVAGGQEEVVGTANVEYYSNASNSAREAIEDAQDAIEEAGGDSEAEDTLEGAISSYNNGNFPNAQRLAEKAKDQAEQTNQSQQTTQLLIYGGLGVAFLAIVVGGVWYWRQQQDTYDKLR
jgi:hypothetical protein